LGAFANAAAGLYQALSQNHYASFRIVTAGMAAPTASNDSSQCNNTSSGNFANQNYNNISIASEALADAANKGVPLSALAAGVHPYHYNTADSNYWRNYYSEYGYYIGDGANVYNQYAGPCGDLGLMLNTWLNSLSGEPVIFTEDNWTSNGTTTPNCGLDDGCQGTYLTDLFTWLKDHGYANPGSSPIRVMWYRGADDGSGGHTLGIYTPSGVGKQIYLNACDKVQLQRTVQCAI